MKRRTKAWKRVEKALYWEEVQGCRQAKRFVSYAENAARASMALSRLELRPLVGLLTGHWPLRYHLSKMGVVGGDVCRLCSQGTETAEHIMCKCEGIAGIRMQWFGLAEMGPEEVRIVVPGRGWSNSLIAWNWCRAKQCRVLSLKRSYRSQ